MPSGLNPDVTEVYLSKGRGLGFRRGGGVPLGTTVDPLDVWSPELGRRHGWMELFLSMLSIQTSPLPSTSASGYGGRGDGGTMIEQQGIPQFPSGEVSVRGPTDRSLLS